MAGSSYGIEGKKALVTGGGRGLGKAICRALAEEGVDVAVADLYDADQTAREVAGLGRKAIAFSANVTKEDEVKTMVARVVTDWGGIDILVNNVGGDHAILLEDLPAAEWDWAMEINLKGLFNCTKAAVLGFTRHAAFELGPYKINVNAVCPGSTLTQVVESRMTPEIKEKMRKATALNDFLLPEDQADAVVFLASERARMITGTSLTVDGGMTLPVGSVEWDNFYASRKQWLKEGRWEGKSTSL